MIDPQILRAQYAQYRPMRPRPVSNTVPVGPVQTAGPVQNPTEGLQASMPQFSPATAQLAQRLMAQGSSTAPVQSPLEGVARALTAGIGGYMSGRQERAQQARTARLADALGIGPDLAQTVSTPEEAMQIAAVQNRAPDETFRPMTVEERAIYSVPEGEVWQISSRGKIRRPGGGGTNVEVDLGGTYDEKAAERRAMSDQDYRTELRTGAQSARKKLISLNRLENLIESGEFETGALQPIKRSLGAFASALGLNPEDYGLGDIASAQEGRALANRMVMDSLDAFSGALSEKELAFAEAASASESMTPEANLALIRLAQTAAQRQVEQYSALRRWNREFGSPGAVNDQGQDFEDFWDAYLQEQGESFEAPSLTPTPEAGGTAVQAGVGEVPASPVITPETDLSTLNLSPENLSRIDLSTLTEAQKKQWDKMMDDAGM